MVIYKITYICMNPDKTLDIASTSVIASNLLMQLVTYSFGELLEL